MSFYRDPKILCQHLEKWIAGQFAAAGSCGAVLGISGGIDSALLCGLLSRAIGAGNVIGVIMPCHSMPVDEEYALLVAGKFKIRTYKVDLTETYDIFESALTSGGETLAGLPAANVKPRLRMMTLYAIAQRHGYLVCGASNKDEMMYGYFTKHGDSGVDILPMADLLKGEVKAVARYIGVPADIIERTPTAGLWEGQTDEKEMGISYGALDRYLATGEASPEDKAKVDRAVARSEHKRRFAPMAKLPGESNK